MSTLYQQNYRRAPDEDGRAYWLGRLDSGDHARAELIWDFVNAAWGEDPVALINKVAVADYHTGQMRIGCPIGTPETGAGFLDEVDTTPTSVDRAKAAIDAYCARRAD